uniref:Uncharacterized protein n=1 Tax=Anopheles atroparvus TaxID=41427 RepID=A0AAG5DPX2_ANOAO
MIGTNLVCPRTLASRPDVVQPDLQPSLTRNQLTACLWHTGTPSPSGSARTAPVCAH